MNHRFRVLGIKRPKTVNKINEKILCSWLESENIEYKQEYKFCDCRRWRFDYALPLYRIGVEIEGGLWLPGGGRHNRAKSMLADMEKYNAAALMGWKVLRYTPQNLNDAIRDLMLFLGRGC